MQLAEERRRLILAAVDEEGKVLAAELARRFDTSEDTIRRDLRDLDLAGLLRRVHGGAVRRGGVASFTQREGADQQRKALLGQALRPLLKPLDTVLIDAGSTNLALARQLDDGCAAAIVTNSPQIALALGEFRRTRVILLGGTYSADNGAVLGARTLADIQALRADLCIVGLCSLAPDRLGATNDEEAVLKRAMLAGSARRAAAVLNERLTASAPFTIGVAADLDHLALEADVPADLLGPLRREGGPDLILAER
ncbi:DeoR/GlpR family DNA-binding transcription regulator [Pseudoduganella umbonata]|uniref:DeoR/GlpR family transcriptional regulator of sugar metabolism n=1 Tax=Pseudoduganella umbonata TaxID=864828 RepID=A0A4P8HTF2_9BURK|nr:DeoR/GlpR family DNA-binding transcription regulator [Pseudoduganella umbonata]MBB3220517.1 DeoR/GlpR family transcriptional regulator of sugar metabolism [Pseudoduganella umbonata]QCP11968.1 DeoR/GlpR transcriptional regulator [Pseudoduganella umbonata]